MKKLIRKINDLKKYTTINIIILFVFVLILNLILSKFTIAQPKVEESDKNYYIINNAEIFYSGVAQDNKNIYYLLFVKNWNNTLYNYKTKIIFQENKKDDNSKIIFNKQGFIIIKQSYNKNYVLSKLILESNNNNINLYSYEKNSIKINKFDEKKLIVKIINDIILFEKNKINKIDEEIKVINTDINNIVIKIKELKELKGIYQENNELNEKILVLRNKIIEKKNKKIIIYNYISVLNSQKIYYETGKIIKPKMVELLKLKEQKKDDVEKNSRTESGNNVVEKINNEEKNNSNLTNKVDNEKININKPSKKKTTKKNNKKKRINKNVKKKNIKKNNTKTIILTP